MIISRAPYMPEYSAIIVVLLLLYLILYEILVLEHKEKLQKFMIGAIIAMLSAFIFIVINKLEGLL